jgi:hypothetical protein
MTLWKSIRNWLTSFWKSRRSNHRKLMLKASLPHILQRCKLPWIRWISSKKFLTLTQPSFKWLFKTLNLHLIWDNLWLVKLLKFSISLKTSKI